jgi:hypothetical protein
MQTLRRWLWMAQVQGLLVRTGTVHRDDAFRYWLKGERPQPRRARHNPHDVLKDVMR